MINIRRKGLLILCILSISMILASCNKGENHAESNEGGFSVADTNQEASMPEPNEVKPNENETNENGDNTTVEPRDTLFADENFVNRALQFDTTFTVNPTYGNKLNIYVINKGNSSINFSIYVDGRQSQNKTILPSKQLTFPYNVNKQATYRIICNGVMGAKWSAGIRARQYQQ